MGLGVSIASGAGSVAEGILANCFILLNAWNSLNSWSSCSSWVRVVAVVGVSRMAVVEQSSSVGWSSWGGSLLLPDVLVCVAFSSAQVPS